MLFGAIGVYTFLQFIAFDISTFPICSVRLRDFPFWNAIDFFYPILKRFLTDPTIEWRPMGSSWDHRLQLWKDFLRAREDFKAAAREHSIRLSELRQLTEFQPQTGEVVASSLTGETGRILRVVVNEDVGGGGSEGVSYVVAVPAASPNREELWGEPEIKRHTNGSLPRRFSDGRAQRRLSA
jgi:hypothetical protein